jgi:RNA polymerase sigma-70 factor (ECF subfamily)
MVRIRRQPRAPDSGEELVRALHAEHSPALLGYVTRLTGDPQRAEDIVQETLLRAWRKAGSLDGDPSSLRSWLFKVARNIAIDEHRTAVAHGEENEAALADVPVAGQLDRALEAWQITYRAGGGRRGARGVDSTSWRQATVFTRVRKSG